jgi:nicotinamide mononucleotide (NMN) deamidase PncC
MLAEIQLHLELGVSVTGIVGTVESALEPVGAVIVRVFDLPFLDQLPVIHS